MDETAGFGSPAWLPLSVRRAQAAEERAEAQQARAAERALAERVEARRSADLAMIAPEAEARGEYLDPVELAIGSVTGHSLADALESAQARWERDDAEGRDRSTQDAGERLEFVGELEDPATRSEPAMTATRRAIEKAGRTVHRVGDGKPGGRAEPRRAGGGGACSTAAALGEWPPEVTMTTPARTRTASTTCAAACRTITPRSWRRHQSSHRRQHPGAAARAAA